MDSDNIEMMEDGEIEEVNEGDFKRLKKTSETQRNIFPSLDEEKLKKRAERFGIDPDTTKVIHVNKDQMKELYESLELPEEEIKTFLESDGSLGTHVFNSRFEALHLRGTEDMSTQDVFDYFRGYAPASIEWINDSSCNVVWLESWQAARAMIERSNAITKPAVSNTNEDEMDLEATEKNTLNPPVPGIWRMGTECSENNPLFIRFATRNDRKVKGAERMSEYYSKYGNPNFGGMVGLISSSRKRRYRGIESPPPPVDSKNPWGSLAEAWRTDEQDESWEDNLQVKRQANSSLPSALVRRLGHQPPRPSPSRSRDTESDASEDLNSDSGSDSSDSSYNGRSQKKRPRMRMYADEEEEKEKKSSRKRKDRGGNDFKDLTYEMDTLQKSRSVHNRLGSIVSAAGTTGAATDLRQKISSTKKTFSPADDEVAEPTLNVYDDEEEVKIDLRRKLQSRAK